MNDNKVYLSPKDFEFIEFYVKKFKIKEGEGHIFEISIILNEYKKYMSLDTNKKNK